MRLIYAILSFLLLPLGIIIILLRLVKKKELLNRIFERFAITKVERPDGKLIWLHAASVGEAMLVLTLIENLRKISPKSNFLVTSGTTTSASLLSSRLPENSIHQFLPVDNFFIVRKFLKYWHPQIGIFIEEEFWPCLLSEASKFCPLILVNGRMSDRSFSTWSNYKKIFQNLLNNFSEVLLQSDKDLEKYQALGVNKAINLGNLKFGSKKLDFNPLKKQELLKLFAERKIIVAASTHDTDEEVILEIIKPLKSAHPESYFILVPRHPERRYEISEACRAKNLSFSLNSESSLPDLNQDIYIVDALGTLGLYYSIAYISFVGGSFSIGGHNPIEPASFGNVVLFGPDMSKNHNLASELIKANAAIQVQDSQSLIQQLKLLLSFPEQVASYQSNAKQFVQKHQKILQDYMLVLEKYIGND